MGNHSSILIAFAGIAVFMYGMTLASENLQKLAANRIRDLIAKLSNKPFLGVCVGVLLTVLIQSSGAVTSMLVGLGTAGVVTLPQVMGVILGATVGTTITVQLLSLNISEFGLPLFTFSFIVFFLSNKRGVRRTMKVLMGFGMIFWGLELIGIGTEQLRSTPFFIDSISYLRENPLVAILVTAVFTALVHSSAATIGFAMSLAGAGTIDLVDAIYWVYGANIGTTATALIASAGGNYVGKQVAWAHCFYKTASVLVFYFFTSFFSSFIVVDSIQRSVANAHTVFNIIAAIMFFPLIGWGSKFITKLFPRPSHEKEFSVKFLDRGDFESASVVIAQAERETLRMGDIVHGMVRDSLNLFKEENKDLYLEMRERDDRVDLLNKEISLYLTQFMDNSDGNEQAEMIRLVSFATDLESAADVIDNNLIDLAAKKHNLKLEFSESGWSDLTAIHREVVEVCSLSITCFQRRDNELAAKVIYKKREIRKMEKDFRERHIERLVAGKKESINTSAIHLDALSEYRRVVGLLSNHVYSLLKDTDKYNLLPRRET